MGYDLTGHLTAIDAAGTANDATFTLDAVGRFRTRVLVTGGTDTYSYIDTSEVVTRIANSGGTTTDSIVSPTGDRLGVKVGATLNWFLPDLHGDIAASLDSSEATVVNAIRYDAYGQTIATGTAGGTKVGADTWKYQGRLDISPTGLGTPLYDMSARFYNPGIGAFTQLDSVMGKAQNPLSMHRFLYAEGNPATLIDPTGHTVCSAANEDCVYQRQNELRVDKVQSQRVKRASAARGRDREARVTSRQVRGNRATRTDRAVTGCTAAKLDCSLSDIQEMTMPRRSAWISEFQGKFDKGGWINAIRGVVDAGFVTGMDESTWFGTVDARIISNIQAGYIASKGQSKPDEAGGVKEWMNVWQAIEGRQVPDDEINRLIANAESASIATGRADARAFGRTPTIGEAAAFAASDTFRLAQRNRGIARDVVQAVCGVTCGVGSLLTGSQPTDGMVDKVVDERDYYLAFAGATSGFALSRHPLAAGFPGDIFDHLYP